MYFFRLCTRTRFPGQPPPPKFLGSKETSPATARERRSRPSIRLSGAPAGAAARSPGSRRRAHGSWRLRRTRAAPGRGDPPQVRGEGPPASAPCAGPAARGARAGGARVRTRGCQGSGHGRGRGRAPNPAPPREGRAGASLRPPARRPGSPRDSGHLHRVAAANRSSRLRPTPASVPMASRIPARARPPRPGTDSAPLTAARAGLGCAHRPGPARPPRPIGRRAGPARPGWRTQPPLGAATHRRQVRLRPPPPGGGAPGRARGASDWPENRREKRLVPHLAQVSAHRLVCVLEAGPL